MTIRFEKYEHSILDVCAILHGSECGSGDPINDEKVKDLIRWLKWRITKKWDESVNPKFTMYDSSVRALALSTIYMFE